MGPLFMTTAFAKEASCLRCRGSVHRADHALADRTAATDLELPDACRGPALVGRLLDIAFRDTKGPMTSEAPALPLAPLPVAHLADIEISDPTYNFVRSIHVYQIDYTQYRAHDGTCRATAILQRASCGRQGDFSWTPARIGMMPVVSALKPMGGRDFCAFRRVFVDWRDFEGTYGFEQVRY